MSREALHRARGERTALRGRWLAPLIVFALAAAAGCGTVVTFTDPEPNFYGGIKWDWNNIAAIGGPMGPCSGGPLGVLIGIIDLPLSFVFDTLMIPVHAVRCSRENERAPAHPPEPAGTTHVTN